MDFKYIDTTHLRLRLYTPKELDYVHSNFSDEELLEFFGFKDQAQLQTDKDRYKKGWTTFNRSFLFFHLIEKEFGSTIGWCGYHTWYTDHDRAEIGYMLYDKKYMGKGYMTEALSVVVPYGFNDMSLNRIEALTGKTNHASKRLLAKHGFKIEGTLRGHYLVNKVYEESEIFGLLKSEYIM